MQILVLLGGESAERDVSYASGYAIAGALAGRGHNVMGLDPATGDWFDGPGWYEAGERITPAPPDQLDSAETAQQIARSLADPRLGAFDVIFIALHGGMGEDGTVQTLLGLAGLKYTGSGPLTSGVAMNKDTTKRLFRQAGIHTPDWIFPLQSGDDVFGNLGFPVIVKPVAEGSTVGVTLVKDPSQFEAAIQNAGEHPMFERFIPGREISVGVLDGRALPPVEIVPRHEIYDYECKYTDGMSTFICPAKLDPGITEEVSGLASRAFQVLGCAGYARVDFRLSPDHVPFCLEVNTLPGMTSHSLVPLAARTFGIDFGTLCEQICEIALRPKRSKEKKPA